MRPPSNNKLPKASEYAVTTHCLFASEIPNSACALGSAIFTIDASRTTIKEAIAITKRARHLFGSKPFSSNSTRALAIFAPWDF